MSYFIEGLEVLDGIGLFMTFFLGVAIIMAFLPQKPHKPPRRVMWHDCPDEVVRLVPGDEIVMSFTSGPFDWAGDREFNDAEWEAKFADEGSRQ